MEYPGTYLTKPLRRALWLCFVAAFFIITPLILLYTVGYRFDWQEWRFRATAGLSVATVTPKAATIFLNDLQVGTKLPFFSASLRSGQYTVTLRHDGYYDWTKTVLLNDTQTTYLKDIELLKKLDPVRLDTATTTGIFMSPSGARLVEVRTASGTTQLWQRTTRTQAAGLVALWDVTNPPAVTWSHGETFMLVSDSQPPYRHLQIIRTAVPEENFTITSANDTITNIMWSPDQDDALYCSTANALFKFNVITRQRTRISAVNFIDWYMGTAGLWTLARSSTSGLQIVRDALGFKTILPVDTPHSETPAGWRLLYASGQTALLYDERRQTYHIVSENGQWSVPGNQWLRSPYQGWWLFLTPWEIWKYEPGGEPQLVLRSGERLATVAPMDAYNTLGVGSAQDTSAFWPYYGVSTALLPQAVSQLAADPQDRQLYIIFKNSPGLWRLAY